MGCHRAWFVLLVAAGCVSAEIGQSPQQGNRSRSIVDDNGISLNGLMANGLMQNGLTLNGAQLNGAQLNGAQLNGFSINGLSLDESLKVMKYLVKCALRADQTITINVDGNGYGWPGALGLAPEWADGPLTSKVSQSWVSACLMALSNADGRSVSISLRGARLPYDLEEVERYSVAEAVFYGDLFSSAPWAHTVPIFLTADEGHLRSIGRRCAMEIVTGKAVTECNFRMWSWELDTCVYLDATNAGGGYFDCPNGVPYGGTITVYDQNY